MNKRISKIAAVTLFAGMSSLGYSEDIEIYEGTVGDDNEIEIQPNVMFILDSSGSMEGVVASKSGEFDYDKDIDYGGDGSAEDDDYVYAYNIDGTYTGVYFTPDQVVCQSLVDLYASSDTPKFTDQALQWRSEIVNVGGTETCTGGETVDVPVSGTIPNDSSHILGPIDTSLFVAGTELEFDIDVDGGSRVEYTVEYYTTAWQGPLCNGNVGGMDGGSDSCSIQVDSLPPTATQLRVELEEARNGNNTATYSANFAYIGSALSCTTSGGTDTLLSEWSDNFTQSSETDWVLECQDDSGIHGLTSSATDNYVAYCPDDSCSAPNYASSSGAGVNWSSDGIDTYSFYGGNYHDFQTADLGIDLTTLSIEDEDTYCGTGTLDDYFIGSTGSVYQCQRKSEIMEAAISDIANSTQNINIGLMRFYDRDSSDDNGGSVILPVFDIDATLDTGLTQRETLIDRLDDLEYRTNTPLSETLYEAYLYFSGLEPKYEDSAIDDANAYNASGNYISPITDNSCQSNNIVYLTDGAPVSDSDADDEIEALTGSNCSGNCLDELAGYMSTVDLIGSTDDLDTVNTYTIGFALELDLLEDAAAAGNGTYAVASDYDQLVSKFNAILVDIALSAPTTLVAPAVSVNAFNELQHRDQIYYAVFKPESSPQWNGNIKKYKLSGGEVVDRNGDPAVDATGFFDSQATSYWSDVTDGAKVEFGGFREQLTADRRVYIDGNTLDVPQAGILQMTDTTVLSESSTGADSDADATRIRDWMLGIDVTDSDADGDITDAHQFVGDALHSKPFVVTYEGTSEADAKDVLFVTTNTGFLHAIDARGGGAGDLSTGGNELWAYIPSALMDNPKAYIDDTDGESHSYGLDGEATVYTVEAPGNSAVSFELDTVHIYQGMRRGGRNYYALDVSDALSTTDVPVAELWTISGGSGGFADLGETWSQMYRTQISYGCDADGTACSTQDVMVFSGGYDYDNNQPYYDDPTAAPKTALDPSIDGNSLYIVNADTGALLWSAGGDAGHDLNLPMYNSIPATPSPIDVDGDGDMDMLFAIDIAGKVWRIDFDEMATSINGLAQGGEIADLGFTTGTGYLRFYNSLDVSLTASRETSPYFNLVVGSGYRAHPKDTDEPTNRLFVVYDDYVLAPKDDDNNGIYEYSYHSSGTSISFTNNHLLAASDANPAVKGTNTDYGFYLTLPETDEKILNPTLTFNGRVVATSYIPAAGNTQTSACGVSGDTGGGKVYVIDLFTGEIVYVDQLDVPGIPPETSTFFTEDGLTVCIGTECEQADDDYDFDNSPDDADNVPEALGFDPGTAIRTYWWQE